MCEHAMPNTVILFVIRSLVVYTLHTFRARYMFPSSCKNYRTLISMEEVYIQS